jgi:hypothetical protein
MELKTVMIIKPMLTPRVFIKSLTEHDTVYIDFLSLPQPLQATNLSHWCLFDTLTQSCLYLK